jgi:O-acetyl-ADP-ribose deacetylase (regulator of RNase III)
MDSLQIGNCRLELVRGDITQQHVDAIVNAANSALAGGGGVDGAIHRAGGPSIMRECREIGGCPTGSAVVTGAGNLRARYVIHAVGPIWYDGEEGEAILLAEAYRHSLQQAVERNCASVAFPSLSTGAYRYPVDLAARVALGAVDEFMREQGKPELVRFVLFDEGTLEAYRQALAGIVHT